MADTTDLIRRARELAKLAEKATPGPYKSGWVGGGRDAVVIRRAEVRMTVDTDHLEMEFASRDNRPNAHKDGRLLAASWDMAHLLRQLADELERLRNRNTR